MKATCLLLLILSPIASLLARPLPRGEGPVIKAASPLPRADGIAGRASSSAGAGRVRSLSSPRSQREIRHTQLPASRQRLAVRNSARVRQPATNNSARPADRGFTARSTVTSARASSAPRIATPTANNVRHRSPNPAGLGGPMKSQTNGTGSISGTGMNRRR